MADLDFSKAEWQDSTDLDFSKAEWDSDKPGIGSKIVSSVKNAGLGAVKAIDQAVDEADRLARSEHIRIDNYSNPQRDPGAPSPEIQSLFDSADKKYQTLEPGLLSKMGRVESGYRSNVESGSGAKGIMQFMPATAKEYGVNTDDNASSIDGAGRKMTHLLDYYKGDKTKAIAAYNWGEGNVDKAISEGGDQWLYRAPKETRNYVASITGQQENQIKADNGPDVGLGSVVSGLSKALPTGLNQIRAGSRLALDDALNNDGSIEDTVRHNDLLRQGEQIQAGQDAATPNFESETGRGLYSGGVSMLQQAPGLIASVMTGSPVPALALGGMESAAPSYIETRARGGTAGESALNAAGQGATEVATELMPMGYLVKTLGKTGMKDFFVNILGREMAGEQIATITQDALDTAIANPDKTWSDYWKERPGAAYQTALGVLVQSGTMGAAHQALTYGEQGARGVGSELQRNVDNTRFVDNANEIAINALNPNQSLTWQQTQDYAAEQRKFDERVAQRNADLAATASTGTMGAALAAGGIANTDVVSQVVQGSKQPIITQAEIDQQNQNQSLIDSNLQAQLDAIDGKAAGQTEDTNATTEQSLLATDDRSATERLDANGVQDGSDTATDQLAAANPLTQPENLNGSEETRTSETSQANAEEERLLNQDAPVVGASTQAGKVNAVQNEPKQAPRPSNENLDKPFVPTHELSDGTQLQQHVNPETNDVSFLDKEGGEWTGDESITPIASTNETTQQQAKIPASGNGTDTQAQGTDKPVPKPVSVDEHVPSKTEKANVLDPILMGREKPYLVRAKKAWDKAHPSALAPARAKAHADIDNGYADAFDKAAASISYDEFKDAPVNKGEKPFAMKQAHDYAVSVHGANVQDSAGFTNNEQPEKVNTDEQNIKDSAPLDTGAATGGNAAPAGTGAERSEVLGSEEKVSLGYQGKSDDELRSIFEASKSISEKDAISKILSNRRADKIAEELKTPEQKTTERADNAARDRLHKDIVKRPMYSHKQLDTLANNHNTTIENLINNPDVSQFSVAKVKNEKDVYIYHVKDKTTPPTLPDSAPLGVTPINQPSTTQATEATKAPYEIASDNTKAQLPAKLFDNPIKSLGNVSTRDFVASSVNEDTQFTETNGKFYIGNGKAGLGKQVPKAVHTYGKAYQAHLTAAYDVQSKAEAAPVSQAAGKQLSKKLSVELLEVDDENNDEEVKGAFKQAGYVEVDGFMVDPNLDMSWLKSLSENTKQVMRDNGIIYINSDSNSLGLMQSIQLSGRLIRGMSFTNEVGLSYAGHDHVALHETAHHIFQQDLTDEQIAAWNKRQVTSRYAKSVESGEFTDTMGSAAEEDFAEMFAENNGNLEKTLSLIKQPSKTPPTLPDSAPLAVTPIKQPSKTQATESAEKAKESGESSSNDQANTIDQELTHAGSRIYQKQYKDGNRFVVETDENKSKREAGERTIGGDAVFNTLQEAKSYAEEDRERLNERKAQLARLDDIDGKAKAEKIVHDDIDGFANDTNPLQKGLVIKRLNELVNIGGNTDSKKNHVKRLVASGETTSTSEENKIKDLTRSQFNRMDNAEQAAHGKKVKDAGTKTIYRVGGYDLGKTAYDYALHLKELPVGDETDFATKQPTVKEDFTVQNQDQLGDKPGKTDFPKVTGDYYVDYFINEFSQGNFKNTLSQSDSEAYVEAAQVFLGENLADKAKPKKTDGVELIRSLKDIVPQSISKRVAKIAGDFNGIAKSLLPFMGNGDTRYYLNGMVIDDIDNKLVASNGHMVAIVKGIPEGTPTGNPHYDREHEIEFSGIKRPGFRNIYNRYAIDKDKGTDVSSGTENWIDANYPGYQQALDSFLGETNYEVTLENINGYANGMLQASKFMEGSHIKNNSPITLTDGKSFAVINSDYLVKATNLLRGFGYDAANIKMTPRAVSIESKDGKAQVIIMSMKDDTGDLFKPYDIKKADYDGNKYTVVSSARRVLDEYKYADKKTKPEPKAPVADKVETALTTKGVTIADKANEDIQDFGDKLEGAKKFTYTFKEALTGDVDTATVPLSKSFPQPDYDKLIASGVDPRAAAFIAQIRGELPLKPKKYGVSSWVEKVNHARSLASSLIDGTGISIDKIIAAAEKQDSYTKYLGDVLSIANDILPSQIKALGGFKLQHTLYSLYDSVKNVWKWEVTNTSDKKGLGGWSSSAKFDTKEQAIAHIKKQVSEESEAGEPLAKFDVWSERGKPGFFVGKKISTRKYIELKHFDSSNEARVYIRENNKELVDQLKQKKSSRDVRRAENNERIGKDYRNGKNVDAKQFTDTFGFRGVQFGNWVNNDRRQQDLNNAYDGLMDLAEVLGLPPKALALNGELGLAFGARGTGGIDAASAHYESQGAVINLTKTNGAGSLAHEWWHAVDNYFGKQEGRGGDKFITNAGARPLRVRDGSSFRSATDADYQVRREVFDAWQGVTKAIREETQMAKRAGIKDKTRSKDYWSSVIELTARTFERYVIDKLATKGYESDYLANIMSEDAHNTMNEMFGTDDAYVYPLQSEMEAVNKAYDTLFGTVETKETDKGTAIYEPEATYQISDEPDGTYDVGWRNNALQRPQVVNAKTGTVKTGITEVSTPEDALHIISSFSDYAQEQMLAIVLDKNNKVIQVIKHTSGLNDSSMVDPGVLAGSIHGIKGARSVYFAHNHPSGVIGQSQSDFKITDKLTELLRGTGVTSKGMLVTVDGKKGSFYDSEQNSHLDIFDVKSRDITETEAVRTKNIGVTERKFTRNSKLATEKVTNPNEAIRIAQIIANGRTGILLMDNQHTPVSFVEMTEDEMLHLRTGKVGFGASLLLKEIHETNARAMIAAFPASSSRGVFSYSSAGKNLSAFAESTSHTRFLDVIVGRSSLDNEGVNISSTSTYFSKSTPTTGSTVADVKSWLPARVKALVASGKLVVVQSTSEAPATANSFDAGGIEGYYDENTDTLYIIADSVTKESLPGLLAHELLHRAEAADPQVKAAITRFESDLAGRFKLAARGIGTPIELAAYKRVINAGTPVKDQLEEFRAYMVTEHAKNPDSFTGKLKRIFDDFIAAIRMALVRHGLDMGMVKSLTPADLMAMSKHGAKLNSNPSGIEIAKGESALSSKTNSSKSSERLAPNGKPSNLNAMQYAQVRTPEFVAWFGDWENDPENSSKVVDENGEPKVFYHGTMMKGFNTFDMNYGFSSRTGAKGTVSLSADKNFADVRGSRTIESFLNSKKPFDFRDENDLKKAIDYLKQANEDKGYPENNYGLQEDISKLKEGNYRIIEKDIPISWYTENGYDSHYMRESSGHESLNINIFNPNQIKSATGNNGQFSESNNDIRFSRRDPDFQHYDIPENLDRTPTATPLTGDPFDNPKATIQNLIGAEQRTLPHWDDVKSSLIKGFQGMGDKERKAALGFLSLRNIADLAETVGILPVLNQSYVPTIQKMVAAQNRISTEAGKLSETWLKLYTSNRAANDQLVNLMGDATTAGIDGSKPWVSKITTDHIQEILDGHPSAETKRLVKLDKKRKMKHAQLKRDYDAMPPAFRQMYEQVRDTYQRWFDQRYEALQSRILDEEGTSTSKAQRIDTVRAVFESMQVDGPYFPLPRFGDYWVKGTDKDGNLFVESTETLAQQTALKAEILSDGGEINAEGVKPYELRSKGAVDADFVAKMDEMIKTLGSTKAVNEVRDGMYQLYLSTLPSLSNRKHQIHRKNRLGWSKDMLRAFADIGLHEAKQYSKLKFGHKLDQIISDIGSGIGMAENPDKRSKAEQKLVVLEAALAESESTRGKDAIKNMIDRLEKRIEISRTARYHGNFNFARNIHGEVVQQFDNMMTPKDQGLAVAVNSVGFGWFLGGSIMSGLVNTTQNMLTMNAAAAELESIHGLKSLPIVAKEFALAARDFVTHTHDGQADIAGGLKTTGERRAYVQFNQHELFDKTQGHDLSGAAQDGFKAGSFAKYVTTKLGFFFHHAERFNRQVSAIAIYRASIKSGMTHQVAADLAERLVWKTHYDYSSWNRARHLRSKTARIVMQFKQYGMSTAFLLGESWYKSVWKDDNISPAEKRKARHFFGGIMASQLLLAGAQGLPTGLATGMLAASALGARGVPFMKAMNIGMGLTATAALALALGLGDDDDDQEQFIDDPETWIKQWLADHAGKTWEHLIMNGVVDALTPMGISNRSTMDGLLFRSPDKELAGSAAAAAWTKSFLGPTAGGMFADAFIATDLMNKGEVWKGLEYLMPTFGKGISKAVRYDSQGVTNSSGNKLVDDINPAEIVLQAIGDTPSRVSEQYDLNNAEKNRESRVDNRRKELLRDLNRARSDNDASKAREIKVDIREFNATNPESAITGKTMAQSFKTKRRIARQSEGGLYMRKGREYDF